MKATKRIVVDSDETTGFLLDQVDAEGFELVDSFANE